MPVDFTKSSILLADLYSSPRYRSREERAHNNQTPLQTHPQAKWDEGERSDETLPNQKMIPLLPRRQDQVSLRERNLRDTSRRWP